MSELQFPQFIQTLTERLKGELPGYESHLKMSSRSRELYMEHCKGMHSARQGAVLILLYQKNGSVYTVFIERQQYDGVHSGQISFPGGKREDSDESIIFTAIREAEEEIGILRNQIHIIGTLTNIYIPPSNFLVTPVVGYTDARMKFTPQMTEVAGIIETDLLKLSIC
ncbi:MAG: CoA pyrophosphatase [Bacteroidales bacterium]|nr:CoA pyrophosphatase [Bacteroidales bacterium]